ncbi:MAG: DUF5801 repeats-in-toxin domain-containing protein [Rhizobiaceae bacterium]
MATIVDDFDGRWNADASTDTSVPPVPSDTARDARPAPVIVAQADTGDPAPVDQGATEVPTQGETPAAEYRPDADNIVRLPAGTTIDNIRVDGDDIVLEQPDGTLIVILDAALNVPTFVIGEIEIPRVALLAALEAAGIDVAFGPDGTISIGGTPTPPTGSGDPFAGESEGGLGDGIAIGDLLLRTELPDGETEEEDELGGDDGDDEEEEEDVDEVAGDVLQLLITSPEGAPESRLPGGSANVVGEDANSGTGRIEYSGSNGVSSVAINGVAVEGPGTRVDGQFGYLTVTSFDPSSGIIEYVYTLTQVTDGDDNQETFEVVLTGPNGGEISQTFNVGIVDDVPTARDDEDSTTEGQYVAGNVMTGENTDGGTGGPGADTEGADGAEVTGASGPLGSSQPSQEGGSTFFYVPGNYGTLYLYADGSYSYIPFSNLDNADGVTDTFTYEITDGDGDVSTATISFLIADGEGPRVADGKPPLLYVQEDALDNNNATGTEAGSGGDTSAATVQFIEGTDNITSIVFGETDAITVNVDGIDGDDIVWTGGGTNQLIGSINGVAAIQLDLAPDLGTNSATVTATLTDNFPHPEGGDKNSISITGVTVVARDTDGTTATAPVGLSVIDDRPELRDVDPTGVTIDEGDILNLRSVGSSPADGSGDGSDTTLLGGAAASGSLAALVDFGADGPADGGGFSFKDDAVDTMTDLGLQSRGQNVIYTMSGNTLIGYVDSTVFGFPTPGYQPLVDRTIFTYELDGDGDYTFTQYDQLDHVDQTADAEKNYDLRTAGGGSVDGIDFGSIIEATDGDGDTVPLDGKVIVEVRDDIPLPLVTSTGQATIHDESANRQQDGANDTNNSGVRNLFGALEGAEGLQGDALGYARNDLPLAIGLPLAGADEPGNFQVSLELTGDEPLDSGLETLEGDRIFLFLEDGLVVGRVDGEDGDVAFAAAIDQSGRVSVAQYMPILHSDETNPNDIETLDGLINAVLTQTDYDGDTVSASVGIGGQIGFRDDGPVIQGVTTHTGTLDDENLPLGNPDGPGDDGDTLVTTGKIDFDAGADGLKAITASAVAAVGDDGVELTELEAIYDDGNGNTRHAVSTEWTDGATAGVNDKGGTLTGYIDLDGSNDFSAGDVEVYTLELDNEGNYVFTQKAPLAHPFNTDDNTVEDGSAWEDNIRLDFDVTVTDGDDDTTSTTISFDVDDDIPEETSATATGEVEMADLGGSGTPGNVEILDFTNGLNVGPDYTVTTDVFPFAGHVAGALGGITIDAIDSGSPFVLESLKLGGVGSGAEAGTGRAWLRGYDADNNLVAEEFVLVSPLPDVGASPTVVLDLTGTAFDGVAIDRLVISDAGAFNNSWGIAGLVVVDDVQISTGGGGPAPVEQTFDLAPLVAGGADQPITFALKEFDAQAFGGHTSDGDQIMVVSDGDTITGYTDDPSDPVFTVTLDGSDATFTLHKPIDAGNAASVPLDLSGFFEATDADGDTIGLSDGKVTINVLNDTQPDAVDDELGSAYEGLTDQLVGNIANLLSNDDYGANGEHPTTPISVNPTGSLGGTITVLPNGDLLYTPAANAGPGGLTERRLYI